MPRFSLALPTCAPVSGRDVRRDFTRGRRNFRLETARGGLSGKVGCLFLLFNQLERCRVELEVTGRGSRHLGLGGVECSGGGRTGRCSVAGLATLADPMAGSCGFQQMWGAAGWGCRSLTAKGQLKKRERNSPQLCFFQAGQVLCCPL